MPTRRFTRSGRDEVFDAYMVAGVETGKGLVVMTNKNDNTGALSRIASAVRSFYNWP